MLFNFWCEITAIRFKFDENDTDLFEPTGPAAVISA